MGRSPKFTLSRIKAALETFGMPPADCQRFLEILQQAEGRIGRPPTRPPATPDSEEEAALRQQKIEQAQRDMDELERQLNEDFKESGPRFPRFP